MKERTRIAKPGAASALLPRSTRDYGKPVIVSPPVLGTGLGTARLAFPLEQPNNITAWTTSRLCYRLRIAVRAQKKLHEWDLDFSCANEEE